MNTLLICLFIAILLPYIVRGIVAKHMGKLGGYDNNLPRLQQARLEGIGARAVGAHYNGFESLLIFAIAVLTAIATNHVTDMVQVLAIIYIVVRIAYNIFYLKDMASLRSLSWFVGLLCCLAILVACMV